MNTNFTTTPAQPEDFTGFTEEQPQEAFTGFTAEDQNTLSLSETGDYTYLKTLVSVATNKPEEFGNIDFNRTIRAAYPTVAEENNLLDYKIGVGAGSFVGVASAASQIDARRTYLEQKQRNHVFELNEITQSAIDKIIASTPKVVLNNSPQKLAKVSDEAKPSAAYNATLEMLTKKASSLTGHLGSIVWAFTPPSLKETYDVNEFAKSILGESTGINSATGLKYRAMEELKSYYKTLSEDEKVTFANTMYEHFKNNLATTATGAAQLTLDVMSGDETTNLDKVFSSVELAAIPLTAVFGAGQVMKGMRSIAGAAKMANVERQLAQVGAKDVLITGTAQRMAGKGVAQIAGAATGVTDMIDAAKLVTLASAKVLPESVTTAVSGLQDLLRTKTDDFVKSLRETVAAKNIRSTEAAEQLATFESKYSPAMNREIHSFHPNTADDTGATLYLKPANETSYLTKEAAEASIALKDPQGKLGLKAVPDTTNTGYLVNDTVFAARQLERTSLEAQYVKETLKQQRVEALAAKVGTPTPEPAQLLSSKPKYNYKTNSFDLLWDSNLDKAIFQLGSKTARSKSDEVVFQWAKQQLGIENDAKAFSVISAKAQEIRSYLRKTTSQLSGGTLQIPRQVDGVAEKVGKTGVASTKKLDQLRNDIDFLDQQISAMNSAKTGLVQGWLIEQKVAPTGLYKDLGAFKEEDINSMARFSMGDWSLGTSSELYTNRVVGVLQSSRYNKLMTEYVRSTLESLSKKERIVLNDALVKGDKEGVEFTQAQLINMGATPKAVQAYMEVRALRNTMYILRNDAAAKSLTGKGFFSLKTPPFLDEPGQIFGKQVTRESASGRKVYSVTKEMAVSIDDNVLAGNNLIYELWKPVTIKGSEHRYIAISANAVLEEPIKTVIPYRKGEFKRVYTDQYFVKYKTTSIVDGVVEPGDRLLTHRTAASLKEAKQYANTFNAAVDAFNEGKLTLEKAASMQPFGWKPEEFISALTEGRFGANPKMEVKFNRTEDDYLNSMQSTGGSQFSQERGEHIKSIHGEDTPNTLAPIDSIAAEISNTAFMVPLTEWRDVAIHRWYNTAKDVLPTEAKAMSPENAFYYMVNTKGTYTGNDTVNRFAQRVQDYVMHEVSVATKEEQFWQANMRAVGEKLEGTGSKPLVLTGAALRNTDFVGFARAVSFHGFLGGFNPVQLLVQGLNAVNAVAISPIHGLKAARESAALRIALMSDREDVWRSVASLDKLSSLGLANADEFVETVKAIRRSGLLDGINSTSLYGAETGKYGLFNQTKRIAGGTSAFFFNRGEEMSRIVSFSVARREFQAANQGVDWTTDAAMNTILRRQDNLTQNMGVANRASYAKGVLSIPTQFLQYPINLGMNLLHSVAGNSRAFTRKEGISLLVGHSILWGTAGMGAGMFWDAEEAIGESFNSMSSEEKLYIQQGVAAGILNTAAIAMTDQPLELALGKRFATFTSYSDFINALFGSESQDVRDIAFGASGGAFLRFGKNFADASKLFWHNKDDLTVETVTEGLKLLATGSFSSLNNIHKAYLAENARNMVLSRSGDPLYAVTDSQRMAMMIGLPPASGYDYEQLLNHTKHLNEMYVKIAKDIGHYQSLALVALENKDTAAYEAHYKVITALRAGLTPLDKIKVDKEYSKMWVNSKHRELLLTNLKKNEQRSPLVVSEGNVR